MWMSVQRKKNDFIFQEFVGFPNGLCHDSEDQFIASIMDLNSFRFQYIQHCGSSSLVLTRNAVPLVLMAASQWFVTWSLKVKVRNKFTILEKALLKNPIVSRRASLSLVLGGEIKMDRV